MARKVDEYLEYVARNRKEIDIIDTPKTVRDNFKAKCNISGEIFYPSLYSLVKKNSCCKACGIIKKSKLKTSKARDDFLNNLNCKLKHIIMLEEYVTKKTKIKFYCNKHNRVFYKTPDDILKSLGCDICRKEFISKVISYTNEDYLNMFKSNVINIKLLSEYNGMKNKVKLKCDICGFEWEANAYGVLHGVGCPSCNESKGEKLIRSLLEKNNIKYIKEYTPKWENTLYRYDFFLPEYKILIEFDGKQHFKEFSGTVFRTTSSLADRMLNDKVKNKLALKNSVKLMRISYSEYKNIKSFFIEELYKFIKNDDLILNIGKEYKEEM